MSVDTPRHACRPVRRWSHRLHRAPGPRRAGRGRLLTALGVALAAVGCAPPGPMAPPAAVAGLRHQRVLPGPPALTLSYLSSPATDGPLVVMVHGTPGSAEVWTDYLLAPPQGVQVLAVDRPGFGHSGPDGALPSLADQAAAVWALLPTDSRPVVLLGHSMGGPVVARVAADHPASVQALVLLAAAMDPALETIHPMQHLGAWGPVRHWLPRAIRNANAELMALKPELDDLALRLPHITAKVVIVHGTLDDLVPVANVPYMQDRLRGAACVHTVLLPGQNHFLPWNAVTTVNEAVRLALEPTC